MHVASVMDDPDNAPVSRAELRRQKQVAAHAKRSSNDNNNKENRIPPRSIDIANARTPSSLSSMSGRRRKQQSRAANVTSGGGSDLGDSAKDKRVNDARVLISSTHANQHLLSRRLGKLEEIERTVAALEKMKAYVSEEEYRMCPSSEGSSLAI